MCGRNAKGGQSSDDSRQARTTTPSAESVFDHRFEPPVRGREYPRGVNVGYKKYLRKRASGSKIPLVARFY